MSHSSSKSNAEGAMNMADPKMFMEAMLSEMRRVMKLELEQMHERIDQMESTREKQPHNVPIVRRRERVQPREVRVEDEDLYRAGLRTKMIGILLLVIGGMEGSLEKLGIGKITTWEVLS